jgi:predicted transcriptional regulator
MPARNCSIALLADLYGLAYFAHGATGKDEGSMTEETNQDSTLSLTADIVGAYVSKNSLPSAALSDLIGRVHQSLTGLTNGQKIETPAQLVPAVPIKKSVTPDYIISLEDGRKFKSMKRYLGLKNMTPAEYRAKWGLPQDYPIVAPNYAIQRSELAKKLGLGRKAITPTPSKGKRKTVSNAR